MAVLTSDPDRDAVRRFPGALAVLAAQSSSLPQPDQLCGPFSAHAALQAVLGDDPASSIVDLALASGTGGLAARRGRPAAPGRSPGPLRLGPAPTGRRPGRDRAVGHRCGAAVRALEYLSDDSGAGREWTTRGWGA
jgi:hypothetical protein